MSDQSIRNNSLHSTQKYAPTFFGVIFISEKGSVFQSQYSMKTMIYDRGTEMNKDTHLTIYLKSNGGLSDKLVSYTYFSEFSKLKNITQIFYSLS